MVGTSNKSVPEMAIEISISLGDYWWYIILAPDHTKHPPFYGPKSLFQHLTVHPPSSTMVSERCQYERVKGIVFAFPMFSSYYIIYIYISLSHSRIDIIPIIPIVGYWWLLLAVVACGCFLLLVPLHSHCHNPPAMRYPLVNVYISMENHHFEWENPL